MQTLLAVVPDHRLAPFVRCFAQRETSPDSPSVVRALVGSLEHILSLDLCDRTIHNYPSGMAFNPAFSCSVHKRGVRGLSTSADMCCHSESSFGHSRHGNCSAFPPLNWLTLNLMRRQ